MRALLVALTLFANPASGAIALEWRGAEAPDASLRLAVRDALAAVDGRPIEAVPEHALDRARVAVSREQPARVRTQRAELRAGLDAADAAFRQGRFAEARDSLDALLASVQAHPQIPGAAASAREAHLLQARIAWAAGDVALAELALSDALRLDPEARLAARRAPPELVERWRALQTTLLAARERGWVTPDLGGDLGGVEIEIDGVIGLRPVPPGPHFVVVYRDGHEPVAAWRELELAWEVPAAAERISQDPNVEHEAICRALALDVLVLAERRGPRVGLEGYRCGVGFGPVWSGNREGIAAGVQAILAGPFAGAGSGLAGRWSVPVTVSRPSEPRASDPVPRPWYRRGWIWGTGAGVATAIAGGVVAGVLLGGRDPAGPSLEIDADTFLGR